MSWNKADSGVFDQAACCPANTIGIQFPSACVGTGNGKRWWWEEGSIDIWRATGRSALESWRPQGSRKSLRELLCFPLVWSKEERLRTNSTEKSGKYVCEFLCVRCLGTHLHLFFAGAKAHWLNVKLFLFVFCLLSSQSTRDCPLISDCGLEMLKNGVPVEMTLSYTGGGRIKTAYL